MSDREILYNKLLTDDASFQLIRTNPKLTGNIKITINEDDQLWLESIKVNPELSKDSYSKFPIDITQAHPVNIYKFLKSGSTPNEIVFELKERVDTTKTSKNFKDQYDFSNYFSGIKYLASNKYSERLSYFAPLYLKRNLPNYFVVFKIKDPLNDTVDQIKQKFEESQSSSDYLIELFKKASIVKTFDLSPNSKVGRYIRNYVENVNFPTSPLTAAFGEDEYTSWNGILISEGIFGSRGELLYDQYNESTPLKALEETITNGFSRNGVICPHILNLEFIFNDDSSNKYDINRYVGFYVNSIELAKLDIDLDRAYANRGIWENNERFRIQYFDTDDVILTQTNPNGVTAPYKNLGFNVSEFNSIFSDVNNLYFNYISDKDDNLYFPKIENPYSIDYGPDKLITLSRLGDLVTASVAAHGYSTNDLIVITSQDLEYSGEFLITKIDDDTFSYTSSFSTGSPLTSTGSCTKELSTGEFRFANESIDLGLFFGQSKVNFLQDLGQVSTLAGQSHIMIKIKSTLSDLDEFKIYHPSGSRVDTSGKYDLFTAVNTYPLAQNPGDAYSFIDYDNTVGYDTFYLNGSGYPNQIAQALATSINSARNRAFTAYSYDDRVFIKLNAASDSDLQNRVLYYSPTNVYTTVEVGEVSESDLIANEIPFLGGSKESGNRLIIDSGHLEKIRQNFDSILVKCANGWSKIKKVSYYIDEINEKNQETQATRTSAIESYDSKIVIILEKNETPSISYKEFVMRLKFRPSFGLLSFFPIKDLDFDFYQSTYNNFPEIDLYNYYFVPAEVKAFLPGKKYKVENGDITIKGVASSTYPYKANTLLNSGDPGGTYVLWNNPIQTNSVLLNISTETASLSEIDLFLSSIENGQTVLLQESGQPQNYQKWEISAPPITNVGYLTLPVSLMDSGGIGTIGFANDLNLDLVLSPISDKTVTAGSNFSINAVTSYSISTGSPLVTYYSDITVPGNSLTVPILDENEELKDFAGFFILKDPEKVVPQDTSDEYTFRTKYLNGLVNNEYDYYKENDSLDFALRSKIIPYITKWGIKSGRDSRNNPYRLNTELVFGRNNFSPDHADRTQNPINFTHEWFYIESKFNYVNDETLIKLNDYYFDTPLNETLLLTDPDYFINYFTYTPKITSPVEREIGETQFRYSTLLLNKANQYDTFFKGFKVTFKDVTDPNVFGADGKPIAKDFTTRFDGYKFSCILKPVKEDINDSSQAPIKYRVIEHTDFKFVLVIIELSIGDLSEISDWWKEVPTVSTISEINQSNISDPNYTLEFGTTLPFDTINGDYRIEFDGTISNLTHTLLYSLKNKKYNTKSDRFSNTKMASKLSLANEVDTLAGTIQRLENSSIPNYPGILTDDLLVPTENTVVAIKDSNSGLDFFIDSVVSLVPQKSNSITRAIEQFFFYDNTKQIGSTIPSASAPYVSLYNIFPAGATALIDRYYSFKVITGGEKYFEKLLSKLSFASFKNYVNSLDPFIEYYSYSLNSNGQPVSSNTPNFYMEILDQSSIVKTSQVVPISTTEIPIQFSGIEKIGFDYEVTELSVGYELNRYKGEYEPIAKNVLACKSNFSFNKNAIKDLTLSNTKINGEFNNLFKIENFNHIKVADQLILELESDSTYTPRYPLLNEVAIGQNDYFLLRGNWDWGFHNKYLNKESFVPVSGALRVEEDDSFIGKVIALPEFIELENFNVILLAENEKLSDIDVSKIEIAAKETRDSLTGLINVNNVLTRYFIEDGISQKFNDFLVNSNEFIGNFNSIEEYVKEYIKLNILKLYEIESNEFYSKDSTSLVSNLQEAKANLNSIQFVFLNDQQRFIQGYDIIRSLQINNTDKLILKFTFNKKPGKGLLVSPKIKIKFI
ncbi:hypothetical protein UFOVP699_14 [uncultured Caudovirales phage]|uniref:Uncharacterized protein n=1 Tax=uncultured Caudovirales phage TaxID=2100421 RepID=A0A6J5NM86_9CAUD|nr:hypothetical protein UFOVP699_14 [uncultured Caudovirales phage]